MTEETILRAVMEDLMFGALEVDLELPDHLKGKAAEMPPVFKNTHVSREDIGDHMKMYAEERGIMNQKRKCLIGSMFGHLSSVEVVCPAWFEGDEDTSSGGVHTCNLFPEVWRTSQ